MQLLKVTAVSAIVLFSFAACSSSGSSTPSAINVSGNYSGTANDSAAGTVQFSLSLSQDGTDLSGNLNEAQSGTIVASGTFSGTISGKTISGTVTSISAGACPLTVTATTSSNGGTLSGSYTATNCTTADTGTFTVSR